MTARLRATRKPTGRLVVRKWPSYLAAYESGRALGFVEALYQRAPVPVRRRPLRVVREGERG